MQTIFVVAGSEQTEVEGVDYYQIVGPVEQVEDKEDGWEEVHSNPERKKEIQIRAKKKEEDKIQIMNLNTCRPSHMPSESSLGHTGSLADWGKF